MLRKHGLIGEHRFIGKAGIVEYIRQAGCIQFDPIDICGQNAELTLQSRVKGFTRGALADLLYKDRILLDYPDKNTSIILAEDWPHFERYRQAARQRAEEFPELMKLMEDALSLIKETGVVCPDDMNLKSDFQWRAFIVWSSGKNLASSVLEQLYGSGALIIHHKQGTRKYYGLTEEHLSPQIFSAPEPLPDELEHRKWCILRRIGAVGLLWKRPSDALLIPWGRFKADEGNRLFDMLFDEGKITAITVEGLKDTLYFRSEDRPLLESVLNDPAPKPRCELIAPLDPFIWDRKFIKAIFGFNYTWEIYTPVSKRKYGHYVLPLVYGDNFIGRVEATADRKAHILTVKNIWYENGVKPTKKQKAAIDNCFKRFAKFNDCEHVVMK